MASDAALYESDLLAWTEQQAGTLRDAARSGANLAIDWDNVAEEIEGLGSELRHQLGSRIRVIIEHLLKLQYSKADEPRAGGMNTVERERIAIEALLEESPSLRRHLDRLIASEVPRAVRLVRRSFDQHGEASSAPRLAELEAAPYTEEQILSDWWPEGKPVA